MSYALHIVTSDTIALWQLQGDLADAGPNGLHMTMERGVASYTTLIGSIQALTLNGASNPIAPDTGLLRLGGEVTVEWLCFTTGGGGGGGPAGVYTYVQCDSASELDFAIYNSAGGLGNYALSYADIHQNVNLGTPNPPGVVDVLSTVQHYALVRKLVSASTYSVKLYRNAVQIGNTLTTTLSTSDGTSRFRIGGYTTFANLQGKVASVRIIGRGLSQAEIANDVNPVTPTPSPSAPSTYSAVGAAADVGRIYRYRPGHMPQLKGNR